MTPKQATTTLNTLFEGHTDSLARAINATSEGVRARDVAEMHITPILADIERNAGQQMDPTYIAYLIQYAHTVA